jgi:hypothetical protein
MQKEGQLAHLVLGSSLLSKGQNGRNADSQVVSTNVVVLGLLDKRPDVRLLQVVDLVLVRRSEVSAHATVVTSDDDAALAGGLDIVHTILSMDTSLVAGLLEDIRVLVLTDTANVHDGVLGEHVLLGDIFDQQWPGLKKGDLHSAYLGTTGGVLCSTTCNQFGITAKELIVESHVLFLRKDGIVLLETVRFQKSGITMQGSIS